MRSGLSGIGFAVGVGLTALAAKATADIVQDCAKKKRDDDCGSCVCSGPGKLNPLGSTDYESGGKPHTRGKC